MTNSQNTKNEKDCIKQNEKSFIQKDLSLTELWQKGELPEGHYYVKDGENLIAEYLDGYFYNNGEPMTSFSGGVDEVLAPVPSYEEWKQMNKWCEEFNALNLVKENEKLKKQLAIAVEALKEYADGKDKKYGLAVRAYVAKGALNKIKELDK